MRVVKKLYSRDEKTAFASRVFDDVITSFDLPMNFDLLEFHFGYGFTSIEDGKVSIGIEMDDPLLSGNDRRCLETLMRFELYRIFVRKELDKNLPRVIEDVIVGRQMLRRGYAEDLVYVFYQYLALQKVLDIKDYIRINIPYIIFHGIDQYNSEMLHNMAKSKTRYAYELKLRKFFNTLKKNLDDQKNLSGAIKAYEAILDAGD